MRCRFLPAVPPVNVSNHCGRGTPIHHADPRMRGTEGYLVDLLLSFHYWEKYKLLHQEEPSSEGYVLPPDSFLFGDSGGYSISTLGINVDPRDVIRWQMRHCDVGVILDIPPFANTKHGNSPGLKRALRQTVANVRTAKEVFLSERENRPNFRWWGVLQGRSFSEMEEWWERISEVYPFDGPGEGWAVKSFPSGDPRAVARCLHFLKTKGIARTHFLMNTGRKGVATMLALARRSGVVELSYDSATPSHAGINRMGFIPGESDFHYQTLSENFREDGETPVQDYMREKCSCPSCEWYREDLENHPDLRSDPVSSYHTWRMVFHNTILFQRFLSAMTLTAQKDPLGLLQSELQSKGQKGEPSHGFFAGEGVSPTSPLFEEVMSAWEGVEPPPQPTATSVSLLDLVR